MPKPGTPEQVEATTIIVTGSLSKPVQDKDIAAQSAIDILTKVAQSTPDYLLNAIKDAVQIRIDGMVVVALAILTSSASINWLEKKQTVGTIVAILNEQGPPKLLEYVELLKSKGFGRGFGSRSQKWVRAIMEAWSESHISTYSTKYTLAFKSLLKLVHPRYQGKRGQLIKTILNSKNTN